MGVGFQFLAIVNKAAVNNLYMDLSLLMLDMYSSTELGLGSVNAYMND